MGYASAVAALYLQEETYGPVILVSKASELRRLTRNWGIHAKQEEVEVDIKELAVKNLSRPLRILFTEPIVLVITIYMSFIYGLLYLNLTAYAIVYEQIYGWSLGVAGLPYMALIIGVLIGFVSIVLMNASYVKKLEANNNIPVPEWRLIITMPGGIIFAAGLFWFGWGGYQPDVHWMVPTAAGVFIGFGIYTVFLQCLNYIIGKFFHHDQTYITTNRHTRHIFDVRSLRNRSQHDHAKPVWRYFPSVRCKYYVSNLTVSSSNRDIVVLHVRRHWRPMGNDFPRLYRRIVYSHAFRTLSLRKEDTSEVEICSGARYRARQAQRRREQRRSK